MLYWLEPPTGTVWRFDPKSNVTSPAATLLGAVHLAVSGSDIYLTTKSGIFAGSP